MAKQALPPMLPSSSLMLGSLRDFRGDPIGLFERLLEDYPDEDVVRVRFGPFVDWILISADAARELMLGGHRHLARPWFFNRVFKEISGDNLFTAHGDEWERQRRLLQPSFHGSRIDEILDIMVDVIEDELAGWQPGSTRDAAADMTRLTLRVAALTFFGMDIDKGARGIRLREAFETLVEWMGVRFSYLLAPPIWVPTRSNRAARRAVAEIDRITREVIAERRNGPAKADLLQLLLEAEYADTGAPLSDDQIAAEAKALLFAGHETTSSALGWTWHLLARHPEQRRRLEAEIDEILGDRPLTAELVRELAFTRAVFEETLRLYPPAVTVARRTRRTIPVAGYRMRPWNTAFVSIYAIHRNPRHWDRPREFDPGRWLGDEGPPAHASLPFGLGPRLCIGHRFATIEAVAIVASVARHFRLEPPQGHEPDLDTRFVLRVAGVLPVTVEPRRGRRAVAVGEADA